MLHDRQDYVEAIKKLFPRGVYWDHQFDNPESDLSLWVEAKADELHRFKSRFPELIRESTPKTADVMLDDWERVLFGIVSLHLPAHIRRGLLSIKQNPSVTKEVLRETGELYNVKVKRVYHPFCSAFFGHTRFSNRMCSPASFSVLFLDCEIEDVALKESFETEICKSLLANNIVKFFYN